MISTPPPAGPLRNLAYPKMNQFRAENGLRTLVVSDSHLPRVELKLAIPVGRATSPANNRSLVELVFEMIKEGTRKRSSRQIAEYLDRWAIEYDWSVGLEYSLITLSLLRQALEPAVELLAELLLEASFPDEEFQKLRTRWLSHLVALRSDPGFLAQERLFAEFYGTHPYSQFSFSAEELKNTRCDDLEEFFYSYTGPRGSGLLFAGAIEATEAQRLSNDYFGEWTSSEKAETKTPKPPSLKRASVVLVDRPHSLQTKVTTGLRILPRAHPNWVSLRLMNQVLGGGGSGRLFLNLRENKGYTYGAYSFLKGYLHDGLLFASADVHTDHVLESVQEIFAEMEKLRAAPPSAEEIDRCCSEIVGTFIRQNETPWSVGGLELIRHFYGLPEDYYVDFVTRVQSVEAHSVQRLAQQFLDPKQTMVVAVGNRSQLEGQLESLGAVRVYDAEGHRLQ